MYKKGIILFVLHSHLPFIYHPEYNESLEERWLFEAVKNSYIPLLLALEESKDFNISITFSFSGTLLAMLTNDFFKERIYKDLKKTIELGEKELERTKHSIFYKPAKFIYDNYLKVFNRFNELNGDILKGFKDLAYQNKIEIITSNLTHCISPFYMFEESNIKLLEYQIYKAVDNFIRYFGFEPKGMWLPECAYYQELDKLLVKYKIEYTFLEYHGILFSRSKVKYGTFIPYLTKGGLVVFGRDRESSKQVWSAKEGYPGDFFYREFYRDIGFDLDFDYIKNYIHESGTRVDTGYKYYRITGADVELSKKEVYDPDLALKKSLEHASNFIFNRERQCEYWQDKLKLNVPLAITAMYDTELFGHWWYEGPYFIKNIIKLINENPNYLVSLSTPSKYLSMLKESNFNLDIIEPNSSSWGWKGYYEYWLNGSVDYMYRHININSQELIDLIKNDSNNNELLSCALYEILQAQCSDWPFIVFTGQVSPYGHYRFKQHISNLISILNTIKNNQYNPNYFNNINSHPYKFFNINVNEFKQVILKN